LYFVTFVANSNDLPEEPGDQRIWMPLTIIESADDISLKTYIYDMAGTAYHEGVLSMSRYCIGVRMVLPLTTPLGAI
jgi:hypothetical protein